MQKIHCGLLDVLLEILKILLLVFAKLLEFIKKSSFYSSFLYRLSSLKVVLSAIPRDVPFLSFKALFYVPLLCYQAIREGDKVRPQAEQVKGKRGRY